MMLTSANPQHKPIQPELRSLWSAIASGEIHLHYLDVKGIKTRVLEAGNGPTLIFLHGIAGHLEAYMRNILPHAAHFRVLAIDMLGHGFTDKPVRSYEIIDYVEHLRDLIETLNLKKNSPFWRVARRMGCSPVCGKISAIYSPSGVEHRWWHDC